MPELPHVYAGLSKLFRKLGVLLHPTTCGPYLLELADPLGQLVVEWDSSWTLYPPWRQDRHREFVQRKHFHLRAEGWKLIVIPLDTFSALSSDEKLSFLDTFCNEQKLNYLRVGNMPEAGQPKKSRALGCGITAEHAVFKFCLQGLSSACTGNEFIVTVSVVL